MSWRIDVTTEIHGTVETLEQTPQRSIQHHTSHNLIVNEELKPQEVGGSV